ncbi:MAG TPA: TadE/TadG family type IV pilus assembly protein [Planctomycetaceae bacterium]|nr:TadE/TadG family type IV pilus assembly protein [Planctomycetaceae bacterium]
MCHLKRVLNSRNRARGGRSGAAAVEFAFVAPVFFVIVMAVFEFGRAMMVQAILTSAAQRGARTGAMSGAQTSDVTSSVSTFLVNSGINGATTVVSPSPPSSALPGQTVTVTVSVPYTSVSWLPSPKYLSGATLSATSLVVCESGT